MTQTVRRRAVLAAIGGGVASLAGCVGTLPGSGDGADRTLYVGAYHWGFVLIDDSGAERDRAVLQRGAVLRLVAFNTAAGGAVQTLPDQVREAVPDHEAIEERNEDRIPPPPASDFHKALEDANEQFPDHSLAIVPSGQVGMHGGMMMHPITLPRSASTPTIRQFGLTQRGDYTLSCLTYCGYGHPYMEIDGGLVVT